MKPSIHPPIVALVNPRTNEPSDTFHPLISSRRMPWNQERAIVIAKSGNSAMLTAQAIYKVPIVAAAALAITVGSCERLLFAMMIITSFLCMIVIHKEHLSERAGQYKSENCQVAEIFSCNEPQGYADKRE